VEENLEEKEFAKGLVGINLRVGWETRGDSTNKATELKSAGAPLCAGVGKASVVMGLHQGTTSEERGVTKSCPSGLRPGEENSTGTLPKFKKRGTVKTGLSNN
jgi:hypothetical protein